MRPEHPDDATGTIGIIAGGGEVPGRLIEALRSQGRRFFIIALEGQADPETIAGLPHLVVRIGAVGTTLDALRKAGASDIVLAGAVRRPSLTELRPDWTATRLIAKMGPKVFAGGDDGLLHALVTVLEGEGFRVLRADSLLQGLLASSGVLGSHTPDDDARADIARGTEILQAMGRLDIGQAVVIQQGLCLGVEAIEGTDALLRRVAGHRRDGKGGVLVKLRKPGQDERVDLPTIGVATVEAAAAAGLRGIAIDAGGTWLVDRPGVIAAADRLGLFVIGLDIPA
ncbi:MAG: UDP-2,3-diacylglucosamine diphosphatase LpxI [Alphaproteobacteria bacterium]|nr:UDP-2,3-diacylglucosamine diphosphatase LpxI [Alphaproteobacteria bacterium]MBU0799056.1 UDP-2,3-diacylglucosamine diphosphatase LpxI [Alphaproteobacteria bacterium]MBU0886257.1 UDP-2,3-diacylglucosamine diphosphatase LpxI [Alphaproteobacteria bacterium]MBU1815102.1 UDP-2,3-diacylglucosamine diphosphatase LpxI [Alphaproteobacteria bacterium]